MANVIIQESSKMGYFQEIIGPQLLLTNLEMRGYFFPIKSEN